MDIIKYNINKAIYPFGFINMGNTCYFNALLQSLLSCTSFIECIIDDMELFQKSELGNQLLYMIFFIQNLSQIKNKRKITKNDSDKLSSLYKQLNNSSPNLWKKLIKEIAKSSPEMAQFAIGQQCSREGFHLLLNNLEEITSLQRLFEHRYKKSIYCNDCKNWVSSLEENNNIFEIEPTLTLQQLEKFSSLDPLYNKERDLNEFLTEQNNYVDKDYICPKCNKSGEKFRTHKLVMIPEILFIVAKKYEKTKNGLRKQDIYTHFPEKLKFKGVNSELNYEAVAQIEHSGDINGGHYWAICKRKNNWYEFNDMNVSPSQFKPTKNTYIVLYHFV